MFMRQVSGHDSGVSMAESQSFDPMLQGNVWGRRHPLLNLALVCFPCFENLPGLKHPSIRQIYSPHSCPWMFGTIPHIRWISGWPHILHMGLNGDKITSPQWRMYLQSPASADILAGSRRPLIHEAASMTDL